MDANPSIERLPDPDMNMIDAMSPEKDIKKAIGNNYYLIDFRNSGYKRSPAMKTSRALSEQTMEDNLRINLDKFYNEVISKRYAYEAGEVSYQAAEITKNAADTKLNMGTISYVQYQAEFTDYTQKKTARDIAALELRQAMENYTAAVAGIAEVD